MKSDINWFLITRLSIIASILLIGFSVFYYLVIFLPSYQKGALKMQEAQFSKVSPSVIPTTTPSANPNASMNNSQASNKGPTYSQTDLMTAYTNLKNNYKEITETISQGEKLISGCSNSIFAASFGGYDQCVSKHQAENQQLQEQAQQILWQMDQIKKNCPLCF